MSTGDDRIISKENLERGELQMSLMRMVAEQNKEKFIEYDCKTDVVVWSSIVNGTFHEIERIEGYYSKNNLSVSRIAEEDRDVYRKEMERCLKRPMSRVIEVRLLTDDGKKIWHRMYLVSTADDERNVTRFAARVIPVQKEKELQEMMRAQAERDSLSGLYSHKIYEKKCAEIIEKHRDDMLFVMIDVDNFKYINDNYGHQVGDDVVRNMGTVLETIVKERGVAGRLGGDEFSVCFYHVYDKDDAMNLCVRIKEAIKTPIDGLAVTASIGAALSAGRTLSFGEFYYEADEAVYFAKEHGKNQIVFSDEIEERKEIELEENKKEYFLTDEELELDQRIEYCVITNPFSKKVMYMNEPARKALGISLEEARTMRCHELFKAKKEPCEACSLYGSQVCVQEGKEQCGLSNYIPDGKFIIESQYAIWKNEPAKLSTFMNVNNSSHVKMCIQEQMEAQNALSKCWSLILEAGLQEVEYTRVLEVLMEYYDADCCTIITKNDEVYEKIYEHHKNTAQNVVEGLRMSLEAGAFSACEVLLDEAGYMRPRYIEKKMKEHPEVAKIVQNGFVHNTIGIALIRQNYMIGILMVLNPRHHLNDYTILKQIGAYFTTDLLRKHLTDVKDYETTHDPLTKMWNREYFHTWLDRYSHHLNKRCGIFMTDIFQLGEINKTFGYQSGNQRLIEMADLLRKVFEGYALFRYDDDQFLVLVHDVEKEQFEKMVHYAKELIAELSCEVSCGYAWLADGDINDTVREAQNYLDMDRRRLEQENDVVGKLSKRVEQDIIEEVRKGNFRMFLQPKVSAVTGKTVGAEGLVRLYNDEKGFVSPGLFIPILEENNAIHLIDMFMLQSAFQFQAAAKAAGREIVPISINFSKNTLIFKHLMTFIKELCDTYGMPEGMIVIEITETVSTMDHMEVNQIAKTLHNIGFAISMDDFGTKYSNMAVLTQFDFDSVKIDRSMILDIVDNEKNKTILKYTLGMLEELGLKTVIEGVETAEQVEVLKELGCDIIQGFYFGRPEPKEKFYELYM